jgi:23S rRNA pseudouridine1911/1915/1917 synthase
MGGAAGSIPAVRTSTRPLRASLSVNTMSMTKEFVVNSNEAGQRLDIFAVNKLPQMSRAVLQKAIKAGEVTVNGKEVKPRQTLQPGQIVSVNLTEEVPVLPPPPPASISIPILYEDKDVVVINKPAGVAMYPGASPLGQQAATVASWFTDRYPDSKNIGEAHRPGIVHRLDKDTSGVVILAKTPPALTLLQQQFQRHRTKKEYLTLVFNVPGEPEGRITRPLARSKRNPLRRTVDPEGKPAITEWRLEKKFAKHALLRVFPFTGRPHQIRVHLHFLGFPIVGDPLYTFRRQRPPQGVTHQLLHAEKLTIQLPSGKRKIFSAPLPDDFQQALDTLRE